ncbi:CapA family protein [Kineosporia rhizophila]|uniref:CapA family protein n=1 Tax=Kineosporia rhizophila TaxID=84633 RepID=UPI001E3DDA5C|nr:CapA family protein [Kineosporia rhizophila]
MLGRKQAGALLCLALVAGMAACSSGEDVSLQAGPEAPATSEPAPQPSAEVTPKPKKPKSGRVRLSFGGDVHFAGSSASALGGDIGSASKPLKKADLAIVNLETAITDGGVPAPKEYTFRAPAKALKALKKSGVDVVTVANNHGMDYGQEGLADTLAAGEKAKLPMIGIGRDEDEAFAPYQTTINGVRISVIGATDVLDNFAITTWTATDSQPGLASAKVPGRLAEAVRSAADESDVVVVVLHWGVEMESCPTPRQQELAAELTEAGAQVVVGSHAHVLEPHVEQGRTAIHYGLGNFVFYATRAESVKSGVYDVVVDKGGVVKTKWHPAQIRGGRPELLSGSAAEAANAEEDALAESCGV